MKREALLIEIGCEEIPSRMIPGAARDLAERIEKLVDGAGLEHGGVRGWGGSRRLSVRVDRLQARQADRDETVLGPPANVAFDDKGAPSRAALGFAKKQGIDPQELSRIETDRGSYAGFRRRVAGRDIEQVLLDAFPAAVGGMSFPKTMRWGAGESRWVRPVQWLVALHGERVLALQLFGTAAGRASVGHRFRNANSVEIAHADGYEQALRAAHVIVDPARRRALLAETLEREAKALGGRLVEDPGLLEEVADLVEWPGVVRGRFEESFLDLPGELLVTTLRHHQKCFSVADSDGSLLAAFLAVTNTDTDEAGHIRRGNEWVVGGRLEDARFFWREDRKRTLEDRSADLQRVVFHAKIGSFADKAARMDALAAALGERSGLDRSDVAICRLGARLCKNDLVTGTVGEFPELQGRIGGLLLQAEGADEALWRSVYSHYQPAGPDDPVPADEIGRVVSLADKLDTLVEFLAAGERPSGSRDPFGLRRAANGIIRILIAGRSRLTVVDLHEIAGGDEAVLPYLAERLEGVLRDMDYSANEIRCVMRPRVSPDESLGWRLEDIVARLDAIREIRDREDFKHLVKLTERVDNIIAKNADRVARLAEGLAGDGGHEEDQAAARRLSEMIEDSAPRMAGSSENREYGSIVESMARFIGPVEEFFQDVLVIDDDAPAATCQRYALLQGLHQILTRYFDIRELAGEAGRRG